MQPSCKSNRDIKLVYPVSYCKTRRLRSFERTIAANNTRCDVLLVATARFKR